MAKLNEMEYHSQAYDRYAKVLGNLQSAYIADGNVNGCDNGNLALLGPIVASKMLYHMRAMYQLRLTTNDNKVIRLGYTKRAKAVASANY
jgi:hypothetical protein